MRRSSDLYNKRQDASCGVQTLGARACTCRGDQRMDVDERRRAPAADGSVCRDGLVNAARYRPCGALQARRIFPHTLCVGACMSDSSHIITGKICTLCISRSDTPHPPPLSSAGIPCPTWDTRPSASPFPSRDTHTQKQGAWSTSGPSCSVPPAALCHVFPDTVPCLSSLHF